MSDLIAPITGILSDKEMEYAKEIGTLRSDEAIRMGGKDQHGFAGDKYGISITGAQAEAGYCKALGITWDADVNTFKKKADSGFDVEIRSTNHTNGSLLFRYHIHNDFYEYECDKPDVLDRKYVLVIVEGNKFTIAGWLWGHEIIKKEKFIRDYNGRPPAWFIPQHELNKDLSSLKENL